MTAVLGATTLVPSSASAALPDMTWSGSMPASVDGEYWSHSGNWLEALAPVALVGAMHFPALMSPACTGQSATGTCYWSTNDMLGVGASSLTIDDGMPYNIGGGQVALGSGGITAVPSANDSTGASPYVSLPLWLTAPQTWSVGGGAENQQLTLAAAVRGGANALSIALSNHTSLNLYGDDEMGPVTVTGTSGGTPSTLQVGFPDNPAALNGTTGNPVKITSGVDLVADPATTGPLTVTGGRLQVGDAFRGGALNVNGGLTVDSSSSVSMYIDRPGASGGTAFSQLSATGNVNLGGASLDLGGQMLLGEVLSCPALTPGSVDTLVKTTGSLTGTFANIPDGHTVTLDCPNTGLVAPTLTIHYTSNAVTATVLSSGGTHSTTNISTNASGDLTTNQSVTLSAAVSADSTPSGTVEFDNNGSPIAGCMNRSLTPGGDPATATCRTTFGAADSGAAVTAEFKPAAGTDLQASTDATNVVVGKGSTTTTLSVSDPAPPIGQTTTYSASVSPNQAGPLEPLGTVQFLDGGVPIDACSGQPLTAADSSSSATCTLSYSALGSHEITAAYVGDDNFTASTSSGAQAVAVQPAPAVSAPSPPGSGPVPDASPPLQAGSSPLATAPGVSSVATATAPRCTLTLGASQRHARPKANQGTVLLKATCDQDASAIVQGTLTQRATTQTGRGRVFRLALARLSLKAGQPTAVVIRLPASAVRALRRGGREAARFTLTASTPAGTARILLGVPSLKL